MRLGRARVLDDAAFAPRLVLQVPERHRALTGDVAGRVVAHEGHRAYVAPVDLRLVLHDLGRIGEFGRVGHFESSVTMR